MVLQMSKGFYNDARIRTIRSYGDKYVMIFMMLVGLSENDIVCGGLYFCNGSPIKKQDLPTLLNKSAHELEEAFALFDSLDMVTNGGDGIIYINYSGLFQNSDCA